MNFAARRKEERKAAKATQADLERRRMEEASAIPSSEAEASNPSPPRDFLDKFLQATVTTPGTFTEAHVDMGATANIVAGSDTTAASLSAILYHLLRNPGPLSRLRTDIASVNLSSPPTFSESKTKLPYLQAMIQESLCLHPAVGLPLVKVVPPQGAEMDGRWFPGGTEVAVNPWVIHYSTDIWGEDAYAFRPERWIEARTADGKDGGRRSAEMNKMWMLFGLGSRTCIGKNVVSS
ncbi:cytochrome P450 [Polychaeton citri CBS 116435]|uniref:Cytochrome P450 n=1 Tax=Polychaeton citri CBS 116435 TaxID=1314669 RepID=A0A9P4Q6W7_9PEZI|nr:cytochrome P450 [Polychaeton citri CBS 116435]